MLSRPPHSPQNRITGLEAELVRAQVAVARERDRHGDLLETTLREGHGARAEAAVVRGQLEEARQARDAAAAKADELAKQLAASQATLRVLEQQRDQQRAAAVSRSALAFGVPRVAGFLVSPLIGTPCATVQPVRGASGGLANPSRPRTPYRPSLPWRATLQISVWHTCSMR